LESPGAKIRDPKQRGEWAELRFMARAMEHGYKMTKPLGGNTPYDVVVDLNGRFMSVQVKSTMALERGTHQVKRGDCYEVSVNHGKRRYGPFEFQYLAAYIIPRDLWYIIPFALVIGKKAFHLRPDDPPDNGYERFREAWHLLREVPPAIKPWNPPVKHERYRVKGKVDGVGEGLVEKREGQGRRPKSSPQALKRESSLGG
jgi:hypothetical protein